MKENRFCKMMLMLLMGGMLFFLGYFQAVSAQRKANAENSGLLPVASELPSPSPGGVSVSAQPTTSAFRSPEPTNLVKVEFTSSRPRAGENISIKCELEESETLCQWYVDDKLVAGDGFSLALSEDYYEHWIRAVVCETEGTPLGEAKFYFSKLPVMYINRDNETDLIKKDSYINASMNLQGGEKYDSRYSGKMQIKGRGNSTWLYVSKKSYKIKLDKSTDLLGHGKSKHYVLLANFLDESLMRNKMAYDFSKKLNLVSMESEWVDVVFDGEYVGNYQLCEHIRVADNRIAIFNWSDEAEKAAKAIYKVEKENGMSKEDREEIEEQLKKDLSWITTGSIIWKEKEYVIADYTEYNTDITGGYLFELSQENDEITTFSFGDANFIVMMNSPEYTGTNDEMLKYVKDYWKDFFDAIRSEDGYTEDGKSYTELVDMDSVVSYWLTMEIFGNTDSVYKSRYAYKDLNEKIVFGPVWDFDWSLGSVNTGTNPTGWKITDSTIGDANFYKELADDPWFIVKAVDAYWKVRDDYEKLFAEDGWIAQAYEYLSESGLANQAVWPYSSRGFDGDVKVIKEYMAKRLKWLDEQFASYEDFIASLKNAPSAYPYVKDADKLEIRFPEIKTGVLSGKISIDGVITEEEDVQTELFFADDKTETVSVYINGIKFSDYDVSDETVSFKLPFSMLTEADGRKNTVSCIGKDSSGEITYRNFATLVFDKERLLAPAATESPLPVIPSATPMSEQPVQTIIPASALPAAQTATPTEVPTAASTAAPLDISGGQKGDLMASPDVQIPETAPAGLQTLAPDIGENSSAAPTAAPSAAKKSKTTKITWTITYKKIVIQKKTKKKTTKKLVSKNKKKISFDKKKVKNIVWKVKGVSSVKYTSSNTSVVQITKKGKIRLKKKGKAVIKAAWKAGSIRCVVVVK